jgi:DNA-binding NarL/FixJ family response regulator
MRTPLRLIIADDHALFRQGLKSLLLLQSDTQVVAEIESADEVEPVVSGTEPDVLLLDLQMDRWMMEDIPQLSRLTNVIVLTASESAENGVRALRLGAKGVVQKRFCDRDLDDGGTLGRGWNGLDAAHGANRVCATGELEWQGIDAARI